MTTKKLGEGHRVTSERSGLRKGMKKIGFSFLNNQGQASLAVGEIYVALYLFFLAQGVDKETAMKQAREKLGKIYLPFNDVREGVDTKYLEAVQTMLEKLSELHVIKSEYFAKLSNQRGDFFSCNPEEAFLLGFLHMDFLGDELVPGKHMGVVPAISAAAQKVRESFVGEKFTKRIFPKGVTKENLKEAELFLIEIFEVLKRFMEKEPSDS